jgi:hypothetical protein
MVQGHFISSSRYAARIRLSIAINPKVVINDFDANCRYHRYGVIKRDLIIDAIIKVTIANTLHSFVSLQSAFFSFQFSLSLSLISIILVLVSFCIGVYSSMI